MEENQIDLKQTQFDEHLVRTFKHKSTVKPRLFRQIFIAKCKSPTIHGNNSYEIIERKTKHTHTITSISKLGEVKERRLTLTK